MATVSESDNYFYRGGGYTIPNSQPTISIYHLIDEEYQVSQFRDDDLIISPSWPELSLTANQIFTAGV